MTLPPPKPDLRLVPPVYSWQTWSDDREPTGAELDAMSEDEYHDFVEWSSRKWEHERQHPSQGGQDFFGHSHD